MNKSLDVLQVWIDGINTGNINKSINLYNEKAVLIPTFSNRLLDTKDKIKDYFNKVAEKEDLSITVHDNTIINQEIGNKIFSLTGNYNWCFSIDGELFNFEARFSFVIDLSKDAPIVNHHSSQIPRTL